MHSRAQRSASARSYPQRIRPLPEDTPSEAGTDHLGLLLRSHTPSPSSQWRITREIRVRTSSSMTCEWSRAGTIEIIGRCGHTEHSQNEPSPSLCTCALSRSPFRTRLLRQPAAAPSRWAPSAGRSGTGSRARATRRAASGCPVRSRRLRRARPCSAATSASGRPLRDVRLHHQVGAAEGGPLERHRRRLLRRLLPRDTQRAQDGRGERDHVRDIARLLRGRRRADAGECTASQWFAGISRILTAGRQAHDSHPPWHQTENDGPTTSSAADPRRRAAGRATSRRCADRIRTSRRASPYPSMSEGAQVGRGRLEDREKSHGQQPDRALPLLFIGRLSSLAQHPLRMRTLHLYTILPARALSLRSPLICDMFRFPSVTCL